MLGYRVLLEFWWDPNKIKSCLIALFELQAYTKLNLRFIRTFPWFIYDLTSRLIQNSMFEVHMRIINDPRVFHIRFYYCGFQKSFTIIIPVIHERFDDNTRFTQVFKCWNSDLLNWCLDKTKSRRTIQDSLSYAWKPSDSSGFDDIYTRLRVLSLLFLSCKLVQICI